MNTDFCIDAVEEGIAKYGKPKTFNTDHRGQFTSAEFTRPAPEKLHRH